MGWGTTDLLALAYGLYIISLIFLISKQIQSVELCFTKLWTIVSPFLCVYNSPDFTSQSAPSLVLAYNALITDGTKIAQRQNSLTLSSELALEYYLA